MRPAVLAVLAALPLAAAAAPQHPVVPLYDAAGVTRTCDATFALVWEDCSRSDAVQAIREILSQTKTWRLPGRGMAAGKLTLSGGVATLAFPPRNFPPQQLIDAARRCLSGALLSGGDTLKSIEF